MRHLDVGGSLCTSSHLIYIQVGRRSLSAQTTTTEVTDSSFYSTPSGIRESVDPTHIPKIGTEIDCYLNNSELARCALVYRDWNQIFLPFLYSAVEIAAEPARNLPVEAIRRNETSVRSMAVTTDKLDDAHSHLTLSSLKTLTLHLDGTNNTIGSIIRNNKSVRFLELSRVFTVDNSTLWESIASLPHIEELSIRNQYSGETDALWDACSRLKKLCLFNLRFKGIPAFATTGTPLDDISSVARPDPFESRI
ncbi:hypothetical protein BGZ79_008527 [Entomortierella chlamydospora]|nr:hypothetical protein BGZ79_008527 [Entomortierella chlamydospora]